VIIKPVEAIAAYRQMLHYYAVKKIAAFFDSRPELNYQGLCNLLGDSSPQERIKKWVNMGGQIVPAYRVDNLRKEIGEDKYKTWNEIHRVYDLWDESYQIDKCRHAWAVLALLQNKQTAPNSAGFIKELNKVLEIRNLIEKQIYESREKDYTNPFKLATFRNTAEMEQVLGKPDDNKFISLVQKEGLSFKEMIKRVETRLTE
jgi:hypothetical protein